MSLQKLTKVVTPERLRKTASLIFLHGEQYSANSMKEKMRLICGSEFSYDCIKVIYPQAQEIPYKMADGKKSAVWFDRVSYSPTFPEQKETIDDSCKLVMEVIDEEIQSGISPNRIFIGGFDVGGTLAMHLAFRYMPEVAGVFGLSMILSPHSTVFETIRANHFSENKVKFPPLFLFHGWQDKTLNFKWATQTAECFLDLGIDTQFEVLFDVAHDITGTEVSFLDRWITRKLPVLNDRRKESIEKC